MLEYSCYSWIRLICNSLYCYKINGAKKLAISIIKMLVVNISLKKLIVAEISKINPYFLIILCLNHYFYYKNFEWTKMSNIMRNKKEDK